MLYENKSIFPKPYEPFGGDIIVQVDLLNYAMKRDLKIAPGIDTSKLAAKSDLVSLKAEVNKLKIDKLKNVPTNLSNLKSKVEKLDLNKLVPVPVDLSKLSNVVKNYVVKKDVYNAKIKNIEDKIPDITNLATKTMLNAKINEVKGEIQSITNLATTTALTAVENKMPDVSNPVKKTDYNTKMKIEKKITDHNHDKITTPEFNKLTAENFGARLAQANLVTKADFDNKLINFIMELTRTKQMIYLLKTNQKHYKHSIQSIFVVKVILKMMITKII